MIILLEPKTALRTCFDNGLFNLYRFQTIKARFNRSISPIAVPHHRQSLKRYQ
ncbi:hypothetical protein XBKQ1_2740006 [Xenorhabdus bovienii str. kraussei Quebec]|uniref:Uncharacterized protein n=1 Tax=Xenorhabdus bovienii str. kraussei Quebec TaxID=1398203 RepID=A0A077PI24_XENBV|nr:hypothetical protein XBKQ1_2740006 [Xenorhabdus bovienii str. kraussei Quebec]